MEGRGPEAEFAKFDQNRLWPLIYHKIREESLYSDLSLKDSRLPEFRGRNRYRDVSPYDHSRIHLQRNNIDYINANLVEAPPANRQYILTQGPLEQTSGHFWLMIWEQNSQAVLMLNRVIEKGMVKCHQYYPAGGHMDDADEVIFDDVDLKVTYISEEDQDYYIIRTLQIMDIISGETREVLQFHYTTWPDFGVPESPGAFLDFLMAVRASGALSNRVGPPVIHCSAGIGRSGTFCLVDTCLVLIEQSQDIESVSVIEILMEMRRYRSGLIQTPDQLRFSYLAIIEGSKRVLQSCVTPDSGFQDRLSSISNNSGINGDLEDDEDSSDDNIPSEPPPPPPPRPQHTFTRPRTANPSRGRTPPSAAYLINPSIATNTNTTTTITATQILADEATACSSLRKNYTNMASSSAEGGVKMRENGGAVYSRDGEDEELVEDMIEKDSEDYRKSGAVIRRRNRDDRRKQTAEQISRMKQKQKDMDVWKERKSRIGPYVIGLSFALFVGGVLLYKYYWT